MKTDKKITLLSTFAEDTLLNERRVVIKKQQGGPAFYLTKIFKKENIALNLITGPKIKVLMTKTDEFGKVPKKPKTKNIKFSQIKTPFLLISTILNDFDLTNISEFKGIIFLDIQGYVRNGKNFGQKKIWNPSEKIIKNIFCIKGTKEELRYLPSQIIRIQKQKLLIATNGKNGCEIFIFGKKYLIKPQKVIKTKNTIGAGDTFFANFMTQLIKTLDIVDSARYGVEKTSDFLLSKTKL